MGTVGTTVPESNGVKGEVGETVSAMDMETAPGARNESTQRSSSREGRGCLELVPHIQSEVARLLHARNGKCLRLRLPEQEGSAT